MAIYASLIKSAPLDDIDAMVKAFRLYLEQCRFNGLQPELSFTRAWRLVRFIDAKMLRRACCGRCGGHFVVRDFDLTHDYLCGLCEMPARAGHTRAARERAVAAA